MDQLLGFDMQKDTYLTSFQSVLLNPNGQNIPIKINIDEISVNGKTWNAYIDLGLIDTMTDLLVNFIGAAVFSTFGFFYIKHRGKGSFLNRFILKSNIEANREKELEE
jgi:hypothetical protein